MSPLALRRYRADRLLQQEFSAMRSRVIAAVRGRLRSTGVSLDAGDLEACYAQAWQGLYTALLEGQVIDNPGGWLVLVTFRRAIEESRSRSRAQRAAGPAVHSWASEATGELEAGHERDLAGEMDDRAKLRSLFEGLRGRLNDREREAAVLCYLQGLSRSEAASRMGVSETRMRKLMEGRGPGRPGVSWKVGALVDTIRSGGWCEEQGSLMRGLAYGMLDPDGERHRLALMHCSECPACRAYVASLRGLAAALPPVLLPWGVGAGVLAAAGGLGRAGAKGAAGASASGVAAGAGGGWALTGGAAGLKVAAGCLLTISIGAGCVALGQGAAPHAHHRSTRPRAAVAALPRTAAGEVPLARLVAAAGHSHSAHERAGTRLPSPAARSLSPVAAATREFGLESAPASADAGSTIGHTASAGTSAGAAGAGSTQAASSSRATPAALASAAREFSPG
jgi:DNA-directed RNA polymerase specialized sigma24 family protein